MGSEARRKLRVLGLHGFRTSGAILQKQLSKWSPEILNLLDLTVIDAPSPARGKSDVEGIYEGPYFEWFYHNQDYSEFYDVEESIAHVLDYMDKHGPFDGLIGFSQGACLVGAVKAVQERLIQGNSGATLSPIKFVIFIAGFKITATNVVDAYDTVIDSPTLHLIGEKDWLKKAGELFVSNWKDPVVIRHTKGHTVPRLDEASVSTVVNFLKSVEVEKTAD